MTYTITCECGKQIPVTAPMCGQDTICSCGQSISVPNLSELRRKSGLAAFEVSVQDRLIGLRRTGKLPLESECINCGRPTEQFLQCHVECERPFVKGPGFWQTFFLLLISPFWAMAAIHRDNKNPEVLGEELVVHTPIRICESCFNAEHLSIRRCKELLRKTMLYGELLDAYPKAKTEYSSQLS